MSVVSAAAKSESQLPAAGQLFLDHVGHFVADPEAAAKALARAGFAPTPISVQVNPDPGGGAPRPSGTGNVCAMLERGYLEVLFKTADTPLGRELDAGRARYDGLHLAAIATADAGACHAQLARAGFAMQPVVDMRRPVDTGAGPGLAAFQVVRLAPGQMPEGRIQLLRHLTENTVWQPRWLTHPNTAVGLAGLTIAVGDVAEASARFARFLGRAGVETRAGLSFALDRGTITLASAAAFQQQWPDLAIPDLPFMGVCGVQVRSLDTAAAMLARGGIGFRRRDGRIEATFPPELGHGLWVFEQPLVKPGDLA